MNTFDLLQEAAVIGFFIFIIHNILGFYIKEKKYLPFLAGALTHIFWEVFGLNDWYCKNKLKLEDS
jgi:hypothetical protein